MGEYKFKASKKKLGSYPSVSVVFSITLALFAIGVFGALVIYSKELERTVKENIRIQVYLNSRVTKEERISIEKQLAVKYFVPRNEKNPIQFISKEDAEKQFIKETGEDFRKFLGDNPLHDAFLVRVGEAWQSKLSLGKIKNELEKVPGVFQVDFKENLIESINANITRIGLVLMSLVAVLLAIVVLLINNTLRLALFSQRFLIRSMQLVGAKKWFIQSPFLFRASIHGLLAGVIASGLLIALIYYATKKIEELKLLQNNEMLLKLIGSLLLLGVIVAVISSYRAVNKYLKLSLDELY
ncbi:MAG TPA: permease-like cell division protein FtsX [Cyclobacteriaceae bacterium]|jgi:cell division transport system permease protein|nr:permease-like cell division protein FtsX [Cyclobacteriaceae bacterium]